MVVERDPADDKFLECAIAGRARYVVTGDKDVLKLGSCRRIPIVTVGRFLDECGIERP